MEETQTDGQDSTKIPENEKIHTEGGWEATMMEDPVTGHPLIIRECFHRWRLIDDNETEREHEMRKKLLNAFNKQSKKRGTVKHKSTELTVETIDGKPTFVNKGITYVRPKK